MIYFAGYLFRTFLNKATMANFVHKTGLHRDKSISWMHFYKRVFWIHFSILSDQANLKR